MRIYTYMFIFSQLYTDHQISLKVWLYIEKLLPNESHSGGSGATAGLLANIKSQNNYTKEYDDATT